MLFYVLNRCYFYKLQGSFSSVVCWFWLAKHFSLAVADQVTPTDSFMNTHIFWNNILYTAKTKLWVMGQQTFVGILYQKIFILQRTIHQIIWIFFFLLYFIFRSLCMCECMFVNHAFCILWLRMRTKKIFLLSITSIYFCGFFSIVINTFLIFFFLIQRSDVCIFSVFICNSYVYYMYIYMYWTILNCCFVCDIAYSELRCINETMTKWSGVIGLFKVIKLGTSSQDAFLNIQYIHCCSNWCKFKIKLFNCKHVTIHRMRLFFVDSFSLVAK